MKWISFVIVSIALCLGHVFAQEQNGNMQQFVNRGGVHNKSLPTIQQFVHVDAKVYRGMFNVYVQNGAYYLEVPRTLLGRDILVFVSLLQGSAQVSRNPNNFLGYPGDALSHIVVRFDRDVKNRLFLKQKLRQMGMYRVLLMMTIKKDLTLTADLVLVDQLRKLLDIGMKVSKASAHSHLI